MKTVKKEFLGETFTYKTEVDEDGKALWTKDIDNKFSHWLYQLREENRELFKIQYSISENASAVLEKIKEQIGVFDESLIVRAITITFINFIDTKRGHQMMKKLNQYKDSPDFKTLTDGETLKKNLYFSPIGMRDIEAYAQLTKLSKGKVLKNALYSVLLISINEDEEIKKFWEKEILEKITTIVKAA
jgi:uncharacterized protein YggT (Ycf19 family)